MLSSKALKKDIEEIKNFLVGDTQAKAKKLDEILYYLSNIKLDVASVTRVPDDNGKPCIRVIYSVPYIFINFDDNGEIIENETFKSINMLNLISFDDMMKIQNAIKNK